MIKKILIPFIIAGILYLTKYILWDYSVSTGKRVGNLTKVTKKGKIYPTWEVSLDEGFGDKLTTYLSAHDDKLAEELYEFEGKSVILYFEEHFVSWPYMTPYKITGWKPKDVATTEAVTGGTSANEQILKLLEKNMFCTFLGSLRQNSELYDQVKNYIREKNLYLYNQYQKCND